MELSGAERVDFYLAEANLVIEVTEAPITKKTENPRQRKRHSTPQKQNSNNPCATAIRENAAQIIQIFKEIEGELDKSDSWPHSKSSCFEKYKHENICFDLIAIARLQKLLPLQDTTAIVKFKTVEY